MEFSVLLPLLAVLLVVAVVVACMKTQSPIKSQEIQFLRERNAYY